VLREDTEQGREAAVSDGGPLQGESERYPQALNRVLHVFGNVMIVVSAVTPAGAVWVIAPVILNNQGSGGFWSMVGAAVIGVGMCFCWSELGAMYPIAGGDYSIIARVMGKLPGFLMFAIFLTLAVFIPSAIGLGAGQYIQVAWPGVNVNLVGTVLIVAATLTAILHIRFNAVVTGFFLFVELSAITVASILAFFFNKVPLHWGELTNPHVFSPSGEASAATITIIATGIGVGLFSYNGYHWVIFLSEETHLGGKHRKLVTAVFTAFFITIFFELLPFTAAILGSPSLADLQNATSPMAYLVESLGGHGLNTAVSLGIALAIFNAVLACIISLSRIVYSSGRDRGWPGVLSDWMAAVWPRFRTPWVATAVVGLVGAVLTATSSVAALVTFTGVLLALEYGGIAVAAIISRISQRDRERPYRMPLWPLPPIIALIGTAYTLYLQSAKDLLISAGILAAALVYYLVYLRPRVGTHWRMLEAVEEVAPEQAYEETKLVTGSE
jgi:amino acid transporter